MTGEQGIQSIIETGRKIGREKLTWGSSGNLSVKDDRGIRHITASKTVLWDLAPEDILSTDVPSQRQASREACIHEKIYELRPEIHAVLHVSPFYATLCACSDIPVKVNLFIESMRSVRKLAYVDYADPGSQELCELVGKACTEADVLMLRNHGVFILASTMEKAFEILQYLEPMCRMNVLCHAGKFKLNELPPDVVGHFLQGQYTK